MHTPVLLKEVLKNLAVKQGGLYIDATAGEGGHLKSILEAGGKVLAIDWDRKQIKNLELRIKNKENLKLVCGNFTEIEAIAKRHNFFPVEGILFDLGLSMAQIENSGRGFSYRRSGELLDMRISLNLKTRASDLINSLPKEKLYEILAKYSEEIYSRSIVEAIVRARHLKKINTVGRLVEIIGNVLGKRDEAVLRRIFQGLRIVVNDEFSNLKKGLTGSLKILNKNGRLVIISFHSLEDRIVKQFIKNNGLKQLNKKVIRTNNKLPFERSAKLRVAAQVL